jgi:hypothetical protein
MNTVNLVSIILLLVYSTIVQVEVFGVLLFLLLVHFAFQFPQLCVGYGFQPFPGFSILLGPAGVLAAVCVSQ